MVFNPRPNQCIHNNPNNHVNKKIKTTALSSSAIHQNGTRISATITLPSINADLTFSTSCQCTFLGERWSSLLHQLAEIFQFCIAASTDRDAGRIGTGPTIDHDDHRF
jgi:hypothetical protein